MTDNPFTRLVREAREAGIARDALIARDSARIARLQPIATRKAYEAGSLARTLAQDWTLYAAPWTLDAPRPTRQSLWREHRARYAALIARADNQSRQTREAGTEPRVASKRVHGMRLTRETRSLIREILCGVNRERAAREILAEEKSARYHEGRVSKAMQRAIEAGLVADGGGKPRADSEARKTRATYDPNPWRGLVPAREARYSERGASGLRNRRGVASRVSIRDNHGPTETLAMLPAVGVSVPRGATREQASWLLDQVMSKPSLATYTRTWRPRSHGATPVTEYGIPVPAYSHEHAVRIRREREASEAASRSDQTLALIRSLPAIGNVE